jgi:hypothetical protein
VTAGAGGLRAGAAAASLAPPPELRLPDLGFVRSQEPVLAMGLPLETTVLVLESGPTRVVLAGVDTVGIGAPEVDVLRRRVAEAAGADPAGVLLNWNHTHRAPPATRALLRRSGLLETDGDADVDAYERLLADAVVTAAREAASRLEPAAVAWGVGEVDIHVNRRERGPDGAIVHGWRTDGLLDRQVVALQARRRDDSAIATVVGFGCHPVAAGMDVAAHSGDYPAALRLALRRSSGGECVFLQGAAGNVLPRSAFCEDEAEAVRMGERLAVEAVHALADRPAWPRHLVQRTDGSLIPMLLFRWEDDAVAPTPLAAAERRLSFPLLPLPSAEEIGELRDRYAAELAEAVARGAGPAERHGIGYHAKWSRRTAEEIAAGTAPTALEGPVHAIRIGDGAIVTGPGETFTEIGLAVKERSPGMPTLYAGYTNGAVGYFPTADAYPEGGYEPAYSNRSYGAPAPVDPRCARLLVETGVRLAESLFPERPPFAGTDWTASGRVPDLPPVRPERPAPGAYAPPETVRPPG